MVCSMNKYHAQTVIVNGEKFDSKKEARRWQDLLLLERAGQIAYLRRQVPYELIPAQRIDGKVVERAVNYKADFVYHDLGSNTEVVEDTKGVRTKEYIIKRKLMLHVHGIRIKEV